jgi:hypothetical protein
MPTMAEMVEAHLLNVQKEIQNLNERKAMIDQDIERLQSYLTEGSKTLSDDQAAAIVENATPAPMFNPSLGGS